MNEGSSKPDGNEDPENRVQEAGQAGRWLRRTIPLALILLVFGVGLAMGWHQYLSLSFLAESRTALKSSAEAHPFAAPLIFAAVYAAAVAASFPVATGMTIFGGFLFGWALSSLVVAVAATAGATIVFLAARSAFGRSLRGRFAGRAERLAEGFERDAFTYLLFLRLAPIVPFFVVNVAPALFEVRLRSFVSATFIGILPAVMAYSWLGEGLGSVIEAAEASGGGLSAADLVTGEIVIAMALLALVVAMAAVVRHLRGRGA